MHLRGFLTDMKGIAPWIPSIKAIAFQILTCTAAVAKGKAKKMKANNFLPGYMGKDVYINLLNPDQRPCFSGSCPANLIHLDGSPFIGNSWLQSSGHKLTVQAGRSCLKLSYGQPSQIRDDSCSTWIKYICEFNCDWGKT